MIPQLVQQGHPPPLDRVRGEDQGLPRQGGDGTHQTVEQAPRLRLTIARRAGSEVEDIAAERAVTPQIADAAQRVARRREHPQVLAAQAQNRAFINHERGTAIRHHRDAAAPEHQPGTGSPTQRHPILECGIVARGAAMDVGHEHLSEADPMLLDQRQDQLAPRGASTTSASPCPAAISR